LKNANIAYTFCVVTANKIGTMYEYFNAKPRVKHISTLICKQFNLSLIEHKQSSAVWDNEGHYWILAPLPQFTFSRKRLWNRETIYGDWYIWEMHTTFKLEMLMRRGHRDYKNGSKINAVWESQCYWIHIGVAAQNPCLTFGLMLADASTRVFYPEDEGGRFLWNVGSCKIHTAPLPRWRHSAICVLSTDQDSWPQIRRPGFDSRHYQKKKT
jgi:hypothetical protein